MFKNSQWTVLLEGLGNTRIFSFQKALYQFPPVGHADGFLSGSCDLLASTSADLLL